MGEEGDTLNQICTAIYNEMVYPLLNEGKEPVVLWPTLKKEIAKALAGQKQAHSKRKKELFTKTEIEQIESYIENRQREGWYYGYKTGFEKREASILAKLKATKESKS